MKIIDFKNDIKNGIFTFKDGTVLIYEKNKFECINNIHFEQFYIVRAIKYYNKLIQIK